MAQRIDVTGYEEFIKCVDNIPSSTRLNCYFVACRQDDKSRLCECCEKVDQYVLSALEKYAENGSVFAYVIIGCETEVGDNHNLFRTNRLINLTILPTLLRWKCPQRLEGSYYCMKDDILELFFTDEIDD